MVGEDIQKKTVTAQAGQWRFTGPAPSSCDPFDRLFRMSADRIEQHSKHSFVNGERYFVKEDQLCMILMLWAEVVLRKTTDKAHH